MSMTIPATIISISGTEYSAAYSAGAYNSSGSTIATGAAAFKNALCLSTTVGTTTIGSSALIIGITTKSELSEDDYSFDSSNSAFISCRFENNNFYLNVLNTGSTDLSFNTIQFAGRFYDSGTSSQSAYYFLLVEIPLGTVTLEPDQSKTYRISKDFAEET